MSYGTPYVGAAIDGTHIPYFPNFGEWQRDYKNYKLLCSMLFIGMINSQYFFVDLDVGWPGHLHYKTCTGYNYLWGKMHKDSKFWQFWHGEDGVVEADRIWGIGSDLVTVTTPCTVTVGSTELEHDRSPTMVIFCA